MFAVMTHSHSVGEKIVFIGDEDYQKTNFTKITQHSLTKIYLKLKPSTAPTPTELFSLLDTDASQLRLDNTSKYFASKSKKKSHKKKKGDDDTDEIEFILEQQAQKQVGNLTHTSKMLYLAEELQEKMENCFVNWHQIVDSGFNLLAYGIGSKIDILNCFMLQRLAIEHCDGVIVIAGYSDAMNFTRILSKIADFLSSLHGVMPPKPNIKSQTEFILEMCNKRNKQFSKSEQYHLDNPFAIVTDRTKYLKEAKTPQYHLNILIHSIDSKALRKQPIQEFFAALANTKYVRLVASVEHLDALGLWDTEQFSTFKFKMVNITTYETYKREIANEVLKETKGEYDKDSVRHILKSLTELEQKLYWIIISETMSDYGEEGITFDAMKEKLSKTSVNFSNVDNFLKKSLISMMDQKILRRKEIKSRPYYEPPYDKKTLKSIAEFMKSEMKKSIADVLNV